MLKYVLAGASVGMGLYLAIVAGSPRERGLTYPVVDTGQTRFYGSALVAEKPESGAAFYGQDAHHQGLQPAYRDNGDGTVADLNTGLMWQRDPGEKVTWDAAVSGAQALNLAGYRDWRLPSIKELYSLIQFSGTDPILHPGAAGQTLVPFIDTNYFEFRYGDPSRNERSIDAQYWSSTQYVSTTMNGNRTAFGVNFADGRIKGYPSALAGPPGRQHSMMAFVRYVRGNTAYGRNHFVDNGDGTVSDQATGLMWTKADSGAGMDWEHALAYAENLEFAGYSDWRLPNAKELQSIVDYTRSPATAGTAAIDPLFETTPIRDEAGGKDFPYFWTGTTHASSDGSGRQAVYIAFGTAYGYMQSPPGSSTLRLLDVHGAGAQRCDFKAGDPADYPRGRGPQGDVVRVLNFVRCVRDAK
ncbi:MAG: DUF1566 domain-containing protein [Candidatus Hydrogenedentes bacterium]|nr:DUF1566 domain-containing protein [Candidatus Hydrogenedentota bacterium]